MMNRVVLVGRLVRDPNELRRSANNNAVISFTIAVDNRFTKQEDRKADYVPCVAWSKTAEIVSQYAKKGALVGVEGRLQSRNYEKEGQKIFVLELLVDNIQFLETKAVAEQRRAAEASAPSAPRNTASKQATPQVEEDSSQINLNDDDLPF
jgi:single-strand DNA-binding protein